jgi:hypothetical protein
MAWITPAPRRPRGDVATWKYFLIGLGIGILGAILWAVVSLIAGVGEGLGGEPLPILHALLYIGFLVMVGGPLTFWIILPIRRTVKRRRSRAL